MEHPSTQGVYKGSNNQEQKLQESRKSIKDEKDWFRKAANQSINPLIYSSYQRIPRILGGMGIVK